MSLPGRRDIARRRAGKWLGAVWLLVTPLRAQQAEPEDGTSAAEEVATPPSAEAPQDPSPGDSPSETEAADPSWSLESALPPVPRLTLDDPLDAPPAGADQSYERSPSGMQGFQPAEPAPHLVPPAYSALENAAPRSQPAPLTPSVQAAPPPEITDDRSWWARWNSSLIGASITVNAFEALMVVAFTRLPEETTGWGDPEFNGLRMNFIEGPRVDNDRFFFNYVAHPLSGSEYYMIGRNRGLNHWQGFLYSFVMSTFFEFFIESAYEQAAWQDLWITPVAGTVVGELRWQAKKALEDPRTGKPVGTLNKILYVILDPFDPLFKL